MDSFITGAYWHDRPTTIKEGADLITRTLSKLREIDDNFSQWYERASTRKKALERRVPFNDDNYIEQSLYRGIKKSEIIDSDYPKHGFSKSFFNAKGTYDTSVIDFGLNVPSPCGNYSLIDLPSDQPTLTQIIKHGKIRAVMNILVDVFSHEFAVFTSQRLRSIVPVAIRWGWITYRKIINHPVAHLPEGVIYEQGNDGHWFYLDSEPAYNYDKVPAIEATIKIVAPEILEGAK
jgi:hypothetical protein